jgi:hypothetical protein
VVGPFLTGSAWRLVELENIDHLSRGGRVKMSVWCGSRCLWRDECRGNRQLCYALIATQSGSGKSEHVYGGSAKEHTALWCMYDADRAEFARSRRRDSRQRDVGSSSQSCTLYSTNTNAVAGRGLTGVKISCA